jgi:phosphoenolpyruvate-protein kinase (PTS system EI component)
MVSSPAQYRHLRQIFDEAVADLPDAGALLHGVMFEIPSACLQAEDLLREADFGSIGSNDLLQYLFAVDRDNETVAADADPGSGIFWSLLESMAAEVRELCFCCRAYVST